VILSAALGLCVLGMLGVGLIVAARNQTQPDQDPPRVLAQADSSLAAPTEPLGPATLAAGTLPNEAPTSPNASADPTVGAPLAEPAPQVEWVRVQFTNLSLEFPQDWERTGPTVEVHDRPNEAPALVSAWKGPDQWEAIVDLTPSGAIHSGEQLARRQSHARPVHPWEQESVGATGFEVTSRGRTGVSVVRRLGEARLSLTVFGPDPVAAEAAARRSIFAAVQNGEPDPGRVLPPPTDAAPIGAGSDQPEPPTDGRPIEGQTDDAPLADDPTRNGPSTPVDDFLPDRWALDGPGVDRGWAITWSLRGPDGQFLSIEAVELDSASSTYNHAELIADGYAKRSEMIERAGPRQIGALSAFEVLGSRSGGQELVLVAGGDGNHLAITAVPPTAVGPASDILTSLFAGAYAGISPSEALDQRATR